MKFVVTGGDGSPDFAGGAFAAPPPGFDCVEVSDQDWQDYLASVAEPVRDWVRLAQRMNTSINWKRLVKSNGAAAELARYVSERDVGNAREYWLFLDSEGDLSPELKAEIEAAAVDCGLGDLFAEMTAPQV